MESVPCLQLSSNFSVDTGSLEGWCPHFPEQTSCIRCQIFSKFVLLEAFFTFLTKNHPKHNKTTRAVQKCGKTGKIAFGSNVNKNSTPETSRNQRWRVVGGGSMVVVAPSGTHATNSCSFPAADPRRVFAFHGDFRNQGCRRVCGLTGCGLPVKVNIAMKNLKLFVKNKYPVSLRVIF